MESISPLEATSPASASSREGGNTWPIDASNTGPFSSLSQGANGALEISLILLGILPSLVVEKGAHSKSISSSETTNPGVNEIGLALSPKPQNLLIL